MAIFAFCVKLSCIVQSVLIRLVHSFQARVDHFDSSQVSLNQLGRRNCCIAKIIF